MSDNENSISLNKFISSTGFCSRREADQLIADGKVTINDEPTKKGNRVYDADVVKIDGQPLIKKPPLLYLAFNKPVGIVCTTDLKEQDNIISFINHPQRLFPVGRLDKPSQGLIFLTNDGDIVNKILRAGNNHEKEYLVTVNRPLTKTFLRKMSRGVPILETVTNKCKVVQVDELVFKIILTQGLNRQIRRMCAHFDYEVTRLERRRIMNVKLGKLEIGQWRELTKKEMERINEMVADSRKTP